MESCVELYATGFTFASVPEIMISYWRGIVPTQVRDCHSQKSVWEGGDDGRYKEPSHTF